MHDSTIWPIVEVTKTDPLYYTPWSTNWCFLIWTPTMEFGLLQLL